MVSTSTGALTSPARGTVPSTRPLLPAWPLTATFGGLPLWWFLGLLDIIWVAMALVMVLYLKNLRRVEVPRGFGFWLLFLVWMLASVVMISTPTHVLVFAYRDSLYLAATAYFLYIYNARDSISERLVVGNLVVYWIWTVVGGFVAVVLPTGLWRTPTYYLLRVISPGALNNDLVDHMVVRRFTQYNADSYLGVAPRPSAPFLYTNNWGNAYSLLIPFVIAYLLMIRREKHFWPLVGVLVVSVVPAFMTLNRGMLLGLALAGVYVAVRLALRGRIAVALGVLVVGLVGGVVFNVLAGERLETRLQGDTTSTRASLYEQALESVPESPLLGAGVPRQGESSQAPPVGTQGQFWMLLVSHGPVGAAAFVCWFLRAWLRARVQRDYLGLTVSAVLLVGVVELGYYGFLPYGLPIIMVAAALAFRRSRGPDAGRAAAPTR